MGCLKLSNANTYILLWAIAKILMKKLFILPFISIHTFLSLCMEPDLAIQEPALLYLSPLIQNDDESMKQLYREIEVATKGTPRPGEILALRLPNNIVSPLCYTITQELARNLVSINEDGTPQPKVGGSNHSVKRIGNVFFKGEGNPPLNPPMDAAMYYFYKLFVGQYLAPSCLIIIKNIKIQNTLITGVAQASLAVDGTRFHEFIESGQSFKDLNPRAISAFYIASLLTNPSDYKAKNLMVSKESNTLIGIDNDEACVPPIHLETDKATHKDRHYCGVKHILYCIPELMDTHLDPSVTEHILKLQSKEIIKRWLDCLQKYNENHAYLSSILNAEEVARTFKITGLMTTVDTLGFPLTLPRGIVKHIFNTLNLIKTELNGRHCTHRELLLTIQPLITRYYTTLAEIMHKRPSDKNPYFEAYEIVNQTLEEYALENILDLQAPVSKKDGRITFKVLREERTTETAFKDESNKIPVSQALDELEVPSYSKNVYAQLPQLITESEQDDETLLKRIEEFINQGLSLEEIDEEGGNTALDNALKKGFSNAVCFLINQGAGKNVKIHRLLTFHEQQGQNSIEWQNALTILKKRNPSIAWQLLLQDMLLPKAEQQGNSMPVTCTTVSNPKTRYLPAVVTSQLWDNKGTFQRKNRYGRCDVSNATFNEYKLWVKKLPQSAGFEYAVSSLMRRIAPYAIPYTEFVRIKNIPYLFSFGIAGENLQDLFEKAKGANPLELNLLEPIQLGHLIIMTMITNQSDGKPDNYIVQDISTHLTNKLYRIVCIDNENALGPSRVRLEENGKPCRKTKSVLFCLDQMTKPIPQEIRSYYSTINFIEELKAWLSALSREHTPYFDLFTSEEAKTLWEKYKCFIGIPLVPGMVSRLYDKFLNVQRILEKNKHNPHFSYLDLLCNLDVSVGEDYNYAFYKQEALTVYQRFELVDMPLYDIIKVPNFPRDHSRILRSKDNLNTLLSSENIPLDKSLIDTIRKEGIGPGKALEELNQIRQNLNIKRLGKVVTHFKQLQLLSDKARFLKSLDFADTENIPHADQIQLLEEIAQSQLCWQQLYLKNAQALTLALLNRCKLESITKLDIRGCTQLEPDILTILEGRCLFLKYLNIAATSIKEFCKKRITGVLMFKETLLDRLEFPHLRYLLANDCSNLQKIILKGPKLLKLQAHDCPLLADLQLICPELQDLTISNDVNINDEALNKTVKQCPLLKFLKFDGCPKISHAEVRNLCPTYPISLLKDRPAHVQATVMNLLNNEPTFTMLQLGDKDLDDDGFYPIVEALKTNRTLTSLDLGINNITTKGIEALAKILAFNTTLTTLKLGNAKYDDRVIDALVNALKNNNTLKALCLYMSAPEQIKQSLEHLLTESDLDPILIKNVREGIEFVHSLTMLPDNNEEPQKKDKQPM